MRQEMTALGMVPPSDQNFPSRSSPAQGALMQQRNSTLSRATDNASLQSYGRLSSQRPSMQSRISSQVEVLFQKITLGLFTLFICDMV